MQLQLVLGRSPAFSKFLNSSIPKNSQFIYVARSADHRASHPTFWSQRNASLDRIIYFVILIRLECAPLAQLNAQWSSCGVNSIIPSTHLVLA